MLRLSPVHRTSVVVAENYHFLQAPVFIKQFLENVFFFPLVFVPGFCVRLLTYCIRWERLYVLQNGYLLLFISKSQITFQSWVNIIPIIEKFRHKGAKLLA